MQQRDTTPPQVVAHTGSSFDAFSGGLSRVTVTAEIGSAVVATSHTAGVVYEGLGTRGPAAIELRVPEGTHQVTFTTRDAAGNTSAPSAPLTITNPPLVAPTLRLTSSRGRLPVVVVIAAPANATFNFSGAAVPIAGVMINAAGGGTATLPSLPDGQHTLTAQYGPFAFQ